jgi:hypothetical protein
MKPFHDSHLDAASALEILRNLDGLPHFDTFPDDETLSTAGTAGGCPPRFVSGAAPQRGEGRAYFTSRADNDSDVFEGLASRMFTPRGAVVRGNSRWRVGIREYQMLELVPTTPPAQLTVLVDDLVDVKDTAGKLHLRFAKAVQGAAGHQSVQLAKIRPFCCGKRSQAGTGLRYLSLDFGTGPVNFDLADSTFAPLDLLNIRSHWRRTGPCLYSLSLSGNGADPPSLSPAKAPSRPPNPPPQQQ